MLIQEIREYDEIVGRMDHLMKLMQKEKESVKIVNLLERIHELEWVIKQRIK